MRRRFFDFPLAGAVVVFAFLAASFAVRNSDFWLHLASGRLIAEGGYSFGRDPFAFTTEGRVWANHAWLFDRLLYLNYQRLGYEHLGGIVFVAGKALLLCLLAVVLLRIRRTVSGIGWPAACTLLAVLAMSPRLLLHSTYVSYILLGLTLWLLWRPGTRPSTFRAQLRHYLPLLVLFVLWANLDAWFLLGPLTAALFWLGDGLMPERKEGEAARRTPFWLCVAGLAVCLVNPHPLESLRLPAELMPLPAALRTDVRFQGHHASPWRRNAYYNPFGGVNWANCAYLVLLALGALSFVLNYRRLVAWRLLVWAAFAALSAWLARAIPFFAVVAAPIAALNLQDALAARTESPSRLRRFAFGASYLSILLSSLALITLAWVGWLQGVQDSGRRVDWSVQPDGSLRHVAEKLRAWRDEGKLSADARGFLSHPSLVHYCAWFCPEERGFLDGRIQLFEGVAEDYETICHALNPAFASPQGKRSGAWRSLLRKWGITHAVLYDPALPRLVPALGQLANDKGDWTLLDLDGQALIAGWRDKGERVPSGIAPFDAPQLAFDGEETMLPAAPASGPGRGPRPDDFWTRLKHPSPPSPWQADAAGVLMAYFDARFPYEQHQRGQRCIGWTAALPALPALSSGSLDGALRLVGAFAAAPPAPGDLEQRPPAVPLLIVRAARRALAENPDDAATYLRLAAGYLHLARWTPERDALSFLQPLAQVRDIQIAVALENALRRDPDLLPAHEEAAALYERRLFFDAALEHRRHSLRLMRRAGPIPGEEAAAFARRLEQRENAVKMLERRAGDARNEFRLRTRDLGSEPTRKAEIALRMGLARLALDEVLSPSAPVLLGGDGLRLQVQLQLMLGRIDAVREQLGTEDWRKNKGNLGFTTFSLPGKSSEPIFHMPAYEWLALCRAAADGDYEEADVLLKTLLDIPREQQAGLALEKMRPEMARILCREIGLSANPHAVLVRRLAHIQRENGSELCRQLSAQAGEQARMQSDLRILAAMLDLERGRPSAAVPSFRQVLSLDRNGRDDPSTQAGAYLANAYLRLMHAVQSQPRP
jgi:tetratricopeptide (TPR) repeat protein